MKKNNRDEQRHNQHLMIQECGVDVEHNKHVMQCYKSHVTSFSVTISYNRNCTSCSTSVPRRYDYKKHKIIKLDEQSGYCSPHHPSHRTTELAASTPNGPRSAQQFQHGAMQNHMALHPSHSVVHRMWQRVCGNDALRWTSRGP